MGLREDMRNEPVAALDLREVITVSRSTRVSEAIALMRQQRLGCVVIVDDENRPLGKFTERLLIDLLLKHPDGLEQPVSGHMAAAWGTVQLDDPIAMVIDMMQAKALRFIVVLDDDGHAVGLTGQKGLMRYVAEHFPRQIKVQRMRSKVGMDQREGA